MDHTPEVRQNTTNQKLISNMKDALERFLTAMESIALSLQGQGNLPLNGLAQSPNYVQVDDDTPAPAAKAPKGKAAKPAKEEPKVDYAALREEGDALIKGMAQQKGVPVAELKAIIAKHGAAKFSEAPDDKLEAIVADLRARDQIADSEV